MLPQGIREKLLLVAQGIKKKHKEQQRAASMHESSRHALFSVGKHSSTKEEAH